MLQYIASFELFVQITVLNIKFDPVLLLTDLQIAVFSPSAIYAPTKIWKISLAVTNTLFHCGFPCCYDGNKINQVLEQIQPISCLMLYNLYIFFLSMEHRSRHCACFSTSVPHFAIHLRR
uniref:Uncharacterized protein n=1 Tax=Arundo donax TaxID=35708 RepID=A0A0A9EDA3_ARUDO